MKWKHRIPRQKETRTIRKFAWFPTQIKDMRIWLEYYYEDQTWHYGKLSGYSYWWKGERKLINED